MTELDVRVPASATTRGSVQLGGVRKQYGDVVAVDQLDLDIRPGEFISLLGPSGCGKTTTLRMLAGFEQPDAGRILISGNEVQGVAPHRRDVNTVFQAFALFPHMTVAENVAYGLRQKRVGRSEVQRRVGEALDMVQMTALAGRKPRQLSGGQQQRVALARALVNRPSVLLLDEPLGALDRKLREEMQIELKLLQNQLGTTFVFVTHDQEEALSMSDRIAVMLDGRLEQVADSYTVYDSPATAFVAGFIGQQNFFHGTALESGAVVRTEDGVTVRSARRLPDGAGPVEGQGALAAVRPEDVSVGALDPSDTAVHSENRAVGVLGSVAHLGDVMQYVVVSPGGSDVIARVPRGRASQLEPGQDVVCAWPADRVHVFDDRQAHLFRPTHLRKDR
ncbi:MAG TPA: ABC transporter ATP-binding protein [Actinomycetales bacterium]|nr:ABC transporter ATP-binding protein [Actinomycetales bacterium]